jgi:sialate O-acetylesterase
VQGFAIAGEDKKWVPAEAKIAGPDTITVSSASVSTPVAVRYAWADNPVCNVYNKVGLPLTPFRTDDWKGVTADAR